MGNLLDTINSPADLKRLPQADLPRLAQEIREEIVRVVSERGGHLASSLGAVEIIVSLHYILDEPRDKIVFDVGHQAYAHKLLTGRRDRFPSLRQLGGISGFPNKDESPYDVFTTGHGSTSISSALGLACARDLQGEGGRIVAVIGDGSLAGGMALEALNHAGHLGRDILIILNDNELSISRSVGAMSRYLNRMITAPIYNKVRQDIEALLSRVPRYGFRVLRAARRLEEALKNLLVPGIIFEELGFRYFGPIDGHNIDELIKMLRNVMTIRQPVLIHVLTKKGRGYEFAEKFPEKFHGAMPFEIETGNGRAASSHCPVVTFTQAFSGYIVEIARQDSKVVAITAAMRDGTGLAEFSEKFPDRFFDVGMAEEHAVTFAAGLNKGGLKPVVCIYSTFIQRAYDQLIHDVCLQNLPVVFALDRAGLVGEDGATHHGIFDLAFMRNLPNMIVAAPKDTEEMRAMLEYAIAQDAPFSIRYPRGMAEGCRRLERAIEVGKAEVLCEGRDIAIIAIGSMVYPSLKAQERLKGEAIDASVINARFARPLDEGLLRNLAENVNGIVTVEEGILKGGFGSAVMEFLLREGRFDRMFLSLGLPDKFIEHGRRDILLKKYGLDGDGIAEAVLKWRGKR